VLAVAFSPEGKHLAVAEGVFNNEPLGVTEVPAVGPGDRKKPGPAREGVPEKPPGEVTIWDIASGKEVLHLHGHSAAVADVVFSPDGKTLASAGWDRTVKIWDRKNGQELHSLTGHTGVVGRVA